MTPLGPADLPAAMRAMEARPELAMFPLDNLHRYGLDGPHPRSMRLWADRPDALRALLGLSREGMVMPFAPDGLDAAACAARLRGRPLRGFAGADAPVRAIMAALGLEGRVGGLDSTEPQFVLALDALAIPDAGGTLAPLDADRETAVAWRGAFAAELGLPGVDGAAEVARWIERDSHRLLMVDGAPVALTGFNAALPDIVQVGGVYVPPALRGRRLAARAMGLHLAEARAQGVTRATLVAATESAVRAYRPLGFRPIGAYALVLFDGETTP